ncbi:amino acid adenylation domain-containing protein [Roseivirga sp. BDSF3-8]|uniref:non-ribosomal peptide synthetase n=1 Tax=Roseivirga sp. BDSF3-8 TaxID=3241598 RepID=UPI0035325E4F
MNELVKRISDSGILLDVVGGELQLFASDTEVDSSLIAEIKAHKQDLIAYLTTHQSTMAEEEAYEAIPKCPESNDGYVLSNAQLRLWLASQLKEGSIAYNMPNSTVLDGSYDVALFEKAVKTVVDRHEILRTVFKTEESGDVRQYVLTRQELNFTIDYKDYRESADAVASSRSYIQSDALKAFDLEKGPLIRAALLQLSDDQYVFYYNMHHIISDGWSMDIISQDVARYYQALKSGLENKIKPLNIQYKDYAAWQVKQLDEGDLKKQKEYWLSVFETEAPSINLPKQKKRPQIKTYNGKVLSSYLSAAITQKLKKLTNSKGTSLYTGLVTAWYALVYRYTGETDITVGNPVAGRNHPDLKEQIGFYVNVLALRNQVDPADSFNTLFDKVDKSIQKGHDNQMYPFDRLVKDLDIPVDNSRNPLFDIVFNYNGASQRKADNNSSEDIKDQGEAKVRFDLEFHVAELPDNVHIKIHYNTDVYEHDMVSRLIIHYKSLLNVMLDYASDSIAALNYLNAKEQSMLLSDFQSPVNDYSGDSIVSLFKEQVIKAPHTIALAFEDYTLSYSELDERTDRLANKLRSLGVKKEVMVPVCVDNSLELMVGVLGIIKAGGAYVPIDPGYPQERLEGIFKDVNATVLLTQSALREKLNSLVADTSVIYLDEPLASANTQGNEDTLSQTPDQLAYIMYTSGSLGKPKGVMIEQKSIIRLVKDSSFYNFSEKTKLLATGSFSFDATTFEYWGPLLNGGCLVLCPKTTLLDSEKLKSRINDSNINVMWFTAGWFNQLVDTDIELFKNLKTAVVGGDRLSPTHINQVREAYPSMEIINGYGPTENTTFSLTYSIGRTTENIPIGSPVNNSNAYILNEARVPQPVGVSGELYLGGDGLARGYLNSPELTAEKFISHPFKENERLYRTGDLGRWLPQGDVEFIGRADNQVKIRGYRIEMGEIEAVIDRFEGVNQSVVLVISDASDLKQLIAYITAETIIDKMELHKHLDAKLPDYMVPKAFVILDDFPLTTNGKVDRKALPAPDDSAYITKKYVAPSTKMEERLAAIWQDVLGMKKISVQDDFFRLGGNSLSAIKVISRIRKELDIQIDTRCLFEFNTINSLAFHIDFLTEQEEIKSKNQNLVKIEL